MNYIKLQADILKAADKQERSGKRSPYMYGMIEDFIGVIVDGYYLTLIRKNRFYLDLDKVFPHTAPVTIKNFIDGSEDTLQAEDTGVIRTVADGRKVRVFETKEAEIWIDENALKYFDLSNSTFRASEKNKPLYIYEDDLGETLVGMIFPVNHS